MLPSHSTRRFNGPPTRTARQAPSAGDTTSGGECVSAWRNVAAWDCGRERHKPHNGPILPQTDRPTDRPPQPHTRKRPHGEAAKCLAAQPPRRTSSPHRQPRPNPGPVKPATCPRRAARLDGAATPGRKIVTVTRSGKRARHQGTRISGPPPPWPSGPTHHPSSPFPRSEGQRHPAFPPVFCRYDLRVSSLRCLSLSAAVRRQPRLKMRSRDTVRLRWILWRCGGFQSGLEEHVTTESCLFGVSHGRADEHRGEADVTSKCRRGGWKCEV